MDYVSQGDDDNHQNDTHISVQRSPSIDISKVLHKRIIKTKSPHDRRLRKLQEVSKDRHIEAENRANILLNFLRAPPARSYSRTVEIVF